MRNRRNYYRVLQVQPDAPPEIIKSSYRTLMQKLRGHPDLGGDEWRASLINEAYAVLSDAKNRVRYDEEQARLRGGVGAGARAAPRSSPQAAQTSHPESPYPSRDDATETEGQDFCTFCGTQNTIGTPRVTGEACRGCGSPLRLVAFHSTKNSERNARRIEHDGVIHFRVDSSKPDTYPANVIDLSPTGLRFVSRHRLQRGCVVKLDSAVLSATASVTHCTASAKRGLFATGVRFLTLNLLNGPGTFVCDSA